MVAFLVPGSRGVRKHPRHKERDHGHVLRVWVVEGERKDGGTPQTRRMQPWGHVLRVWMIEGVGKGEGHPRHEECDPGVVFFASGW